MALNVAKGTFTQPGATGNQTVNLASNFDPKALIVWCTPATADQSTGADASFSMGMATYRSSAVQQGYVTYFSDDTPTAAVVGSGFNTTALLKLYSAAVTPTVDMELAFVSFQTGGTSNFVVNWVDLHTTASILVHYLVLGGSEITDAYLVSWAQSTAVATQNVTVVSGFGQPDLIINMGNGLTTLADSAASFAGVISVAKSDTQRFASVYNDEDAAGTMLGGSWNKERAIMTLNATTQAADSEADLSAKASWPTDGFQLTYTDQAAQAQRFHTLALKGTFSSNITYTDSPTSISTVNHLHNGGGPPKGALFFHSVGGGTANTINSSATFLGAIEIGGMDGTNEGWVAAGNDDADTVADTGFHNSSSKGIGIFETDGTVSVLAEADTSISGNDIALSWTTVHTSAHRIGILSLGDYIPPPDFPIVTKQIHDPPARRVRY